MRFTVKMVTALLLVCGVFLSGCQSANNNAPTDVTILPSSEITTVSTVTSPQDTTASPEQTTMPKETTAPPEQTTMPKETVVPEQSPKPPKQFRALLALREKVVEYVKKYGKDEICLDFSDEFVRACTEACAPDKPELVEALLRNLKLEEDALYKSSDENESPRSGYAVLDLNGDGIDELIFLTETHTLFGVCMLLDGVYFFPKLEKFVNYKYCEATIIREGVIYYNWYEKGDLYGHEFVRLNKNGTWDQVFAIRHTFHKAEGFDPYFCEDMELYRSLEFYHMQINGGKPIELTADEYDSVALRVPISSETYEYLNKDIVFVPFESLYRQQTTEG